MALSPQPDIRFFRNTGLALVTATLTAGAITLSLTLTERSSITLVDNSDGLTERGTEIAGSMVATTGADATSSPIVGGSLSTGGLAEPLQEKVLN